MLRHTVIIFCAQVLLAQFAFSQALRGLAGNTGSVAIGNGNIGNCLANAEVLVPSSVFNGGVISEIVPNLQFGDMTVNGELPIGGSIKVCGCFPVYGTVAVDGCIPSSGTATVNTGGSFSAQVLENNCRCA